METPAPIPMPALQEVYVPQKLKAFMSEPQGCALISALESQFHCHISVVNDALIVGSVGSAGSSSVDIAQIESIIRDVWQKRDVQMMIREAALNASCTHICQTILPRAYCAVAFYFAADIQRRSRCNDIIVEHFAGKVSIYGGEQTVNVARELLIECLTDHFGALEMEIPAVRRTTRMGFQSSFGAFSMGEPNAILTPAPFDEQLLFTPPVSMQLQPVVESPPATNNVEKVKHWIPTEDVGKILGNRAAMKKQIEAQFKCVISVHTGACPQFGMTAVEIMAQSQEQAHGARDAVMLLMATHQEQAVNKSSPDSGFCSPASGGETPEKRKYFRSSFRDQPKVILELTPRKNLSQLTGNEHLE